MFTIQRRRKMIDIEESYYTITKVTESYDCDQGSCKLYEFEYGDKTFQVGIYEGDKVISILEEE
jgi:hypothetical protein|tara:strand:+ start:14 stop:205 length:192 start_codon:yes stop_codon:yes gene_type:complete